MLIVWNKSKCNQRKLNQYMFNRTRIVCRIVRNNKTNDKEISFSNTLSVYHFITVVSDDESGDKVKQCSRGN